MINFLRKVFPSMIGIAIYAWLVSVFFRTWQDPVAVDNGRWVNSGFSLLFLEMILVISGIIFCLLTDPAVSLKVNGEHLSEARKRDFQRGTGPWKVVLGFIIVGIIFGYAFGVMNISVLLVLAMVLVSRFIGFLTDSESQKNEQRRRFYIGAPLYLICMIAVSNLTCPRGGITSESLKEVGYSTAGLKGVQEHPERLLWACMVYFGLLALAELVLLFVPTKVPEVNEDQSGDDSSEATV